MKKVLVFAPHNDDEVLGCGGTIALLAEKGFDVTVCEVTSGKNTERVLKIKEEALRAHSIIGVKQSIFLDLPVITLNSIPQDEITKVFSDTVNQVKPNIVFLPNKGDMHIDHKIVTEAAMVAIRPLHAPFVEDVYIYETLSETEWNIPSVENVFIPNYWVDISKTFSKKVDAMSCYETQLCHFPHPRSIDAIEALASFRGSTVGVNKAEAFMHIRGILKND